MITVRKSILLAASFMFAGMVSCNSDISDKDPIIVDEASSSSTATDYTATEYSVAPELTSAPAATPAPAQTAAINPPHGQPGHDCAVAVGAPLTGTPTGLTTAAAPTRISTPPPVTPLTGPIPRFNAALNVNPAHGQPGHDCAVAVGAPLPSPTARTTTTTTPAAITTKPVIASPLGGPTPQFNANAKLNPAHGQPGHDCAVAVGAPLPSK